MDTQILVTEPFDVIPPLSWDNPGEARILRYMEEAFGFEIAEMATLPKEQYLQEVYELMLLNNPPETDRDETEYNPYKPYEY